MVHPRQRDDDLVYLALLNHPGQVAYRTQCCQATDVGLSLLGVIVHEADHLITQLRPGHDGAHHGTANLAGTDDEDAVHPDAASVQMSHNGVVHDAR